MRNPKRGKISSLKFERSEKENDEHAKYREEREKKVMIELLQPMVCPNQDGWSLVKQTHEREGAPKPTF